MQKDTISFRITANNKQALREWQQRMQLPSKTAAFNQMIRMASLFMRWTQAGNGLLQGMDWYVPPKDATERFFIDDMTEDQREIFFKSFTKPSSRMQYDDAYKAK